MKILSFIFMAIFALTINASPSADRRIVDGEQVIPGTVTHQAVLSFINSGFLFAGGSIISVSHVLTVATYLIGRGHNSIGITVGATYLPASTEYRSDLIVIHHDYDRSLNINNIAIVRSFQHFELNHFVRPIVLGTSVISPGTSARISGFGATSTTKGPDSHILHVKNVDMAVGHRADR
ncbi:hypothetical protein PVAND_012506 [Polypedilum vanderplanki]|uniref:Peptidase S1 domain-containing protein n=1 Tax=Polypedilum vanderplanki TaxID=319348 RepID=A0A9J6CLR2_POLVA|nr:hypothetical protein PVAND_012506 [Polypedilum vanderplanki]